jgi:ribosomal protein S13
MKLHFIDSLIPFRKPLSVLEQMSIYKLLNLRTGISASISRMICNLSGYHPNLNVGSIRRTYISNRVRRFFALKSNFMDKSVIELQAAGVTLDIRLQTNKGRRHVDGYPVNGQRTRTNAKTKKKLKKFYV